MKLNNYRKLFFGYILLILGLSSIPGYSMPNLKILSYDKIIHLIEYSILGVLFTYSFFPITGKKIIMILLVSSIFAVFDETLQGFIPGRNSSLYDVYADIFGVMIGILYVRIRVWRNA